MSAARPAGAALAAALLCGAASASDAQEQYLVLGEGAQSCAVLNEAFGKGDSPVILRFAAWAHGYASAYNATLKDTYNVLGTKTLDEFLVDIVMTCQADNTQNVHDATNTVLRDLYPTRATSAP